MNTNTLIIFIIIIVIIAGFFLFRTTPTTTTTSTTETTSPTSLVVNISAQNNSGESGTAIITDENGKAKVTLNLTGQPANASQPAHIHIGACPAPGDVKYPLAPVVNGQSLTMLDISTSQLLAQMPLAINVHKSDKEITAYISCGNIQ